jgi:ABC-type polysaccharide/polyol phosphate export permease
VSSVNPVTKILETARQGFLGDVTWSATWPGLTVIVVLASVLSVLAVRRLRSFAP